MSFALMHTELFKGKMQMSGGQWTARQKRRRTEIITLGGKLIC